MDSWVWYQVGLELGNIDVKGTVESKGGGQRGDNLGNESVQVGVGWSLNVEVSSGDIIDGLVIKDNGNISVLQKGVSGEHGVVWLYNSGGNLWGWVDGETELGFLTVVNGKSLEEERSETGSGTSTDGVEDEETLETCALIRELSDSIKAEINDFFTNGVMSSGEVVGSIFFTGDELLGMVKLSVCSCSSLIKNRWLQINKDCSWNKFAITSF